MVKDTRPETLDIPLDCNRDLEEIGPPRNSCPGSRPRFAPAVRGSLPPRRHAPVRMPDGALRRRLAVVLRLLHREKPRQFGTHHTLPELLDLLEGAQRVRKLIAVVGVQQFAGFVAQADRPSSATTRCATAPDKTRARLDAWCEPHLWARRETDGSLPIRWAMTHLRHRALN